MALCMKRYQRHYCQFTEGHPGPCSWARAVSDLNPNFAAQAMSLAEMIEAGEYDPYLELILSAAHDRKRALRSTPGFPRKARRH